MNDVQLEISEGKGLAALNEMTYFVKLNCLLVNDFYVCALLVGMQT